VKLSTHLHPEQSSRIIGAALPSTLPVFMTCTGTILPFILNDTKLYNKGRKERRKEREELSETEKVFCPCVYLIKVRRREDVWGSAGKTPLFLTSALDSGGQLHAPPALPPVISDATMKINFHVQGIELRFSFLSA
jgi:hypothetical protein